MNFKFKKRNATFGDAFKNHKKKSGGEKTITLRVEHSVSPKELDMLIPAQGVPTSEFLFGENPFKKPALQTYVVFPMAVNRNPEGVSVTIHDQKSPLKFENVAVTGIVISIDEDGKKMILGYDLQIPVGRYLQRISEYVEGNTLPFECVNTQEELFGEEAEEAAAAGAPVDPDDPPPVADGDGINDDDDEDD